MTQPTGEPGAPGQPPPGGPPPSWQQAPQAARPAAAAPAPPPQSWQQAPQQPVPPVAPAPPPPPPSWTAGLTSTAPIAGPAGFVYGDVPNRSIAFIIDFLVMGLISLVIGAITLAILGDKVTVGSVQTTNASMLSTFSYNLLSYAIIAVYFWYTWTRMRATVGMKLLGMQIGHEVDGRTLDNNQAMIRLVAMFGPGFVAGVLSAFAVSLATAANLVAFIWFLALLYTTAKSPTHQGLHDQYAHTMVVKSTRRTG